VDEVDEVVDGGEKYSSCSPESSRRAGRRLARLDGVVGLLLLRLRTASWRFNDKKLEFVRTMREIGKQGFTEAEKWIGHTRGHREWECVKKCARGFLQGSLSI
jgi:hypothetical protein